MCVRHVDRPKSQALAWRQPSCQKPVIEGHVGELRVIGALSPPRPADGVLVRAAEAGEERFHKRSIAAREDDVSAVARKAPVRREQSDDVGRRRRPLEWKGSVAANTSVLRKVDVTLVSPGSRFRARSHMRIYA